ncbi:sulfatase-like protein [Phytophthora infestans T30-4]|uniref:Sulfatase-like protein n=1 Tax=Phytophthora infestans (strain T30-4) TaxID=403677 RepID=D0RLW6_PHYIT|nr:sulfatase-like protein [Phytophthora infestans T30-4]EEY54590.1 sulfatase-like protein [Phytophthora infestans T30-4]|eukprot:XP_002909964.1 sulfatase-like protein [Phytophthora infestans T30-4]
MVVVALSRATTPLIAYAALNTTLNELLQHVLEPAMGGSSAFGDADRLGVESFIDSNEERTLYGNRTLYRRTTGFRGDLAFNVSVSDLDPPNVIVIAVESFRFHDSHYLVGDEDPSNLFKGSNITVTPSFDKWAKRGIALRNYWSSWRTSRSVESLMFGQLPYDSVTRSGTTGGQRGTTLSGLPQLFKAKDYETFFTTGCVTDYDTDLGIKPSDWEGLEHRALDWGVHDDLTFQLLGDLLVNKTKAQRSRMAKGEAKKPLFLNHYTISSHVNYKQRWLKLGS